MNNDWDLKPKPYTECEIDGEIVPFDAQGSGNLDELKDFYKKAFEYIGSGTVVYYDGRKHIEKELHHYFKKKVNNQ